MKAFKQKFYALFFLLIPLVGSAQIDESKTGAWYMYLWNTSIGENGFGFQGDIQYRNWNAVGDLEQLLLRGGLTYSPKTSSAKFTLGYGNIQTGAYGDEKTTTSESRIYQEAMLPHHAGGRFFLTHRFRYEQRFVENQDFRTRYRYNLFLTVPLNHTIIGDKTVYLSLYNELFINGQRSIGNGREVEVFDRNRSYLALGYAIKQQLRVQGGIMRQITDNWGKTQMQLSLHHKF
ncbi:MAG: DUF2490 domain-containing protein [Cyclobacteriaceae bacterium]|nr:DUF2490 domain-containing protein [Cyclobacteriaceae bacterium]